MGAVAPLLGVRVPAVLSCPCSASRGQLVVQLLFVAHWLPMGPGQAGWAGGGGTNPVFEFLLRVTLSCLFSPRSIESPSLGFCTDALLPNLLEDDLGQLSDLEPEPDAQNWQHTVGKDVVAGLSQREIDRQEVINGETQAGTGAGRLRRRWW